MKIKNLWMSVCSLVLLAGECFPEENAALFAGYNCRTGIVYKTVNGETFDLALFLPKEKKYPKTPLMIYIHGGGWEKGDKSRIFNRGTLDLLLEKGIACASVEYRLIRAGLSTAYDCTVDCKDAARFLVKYADEYGLDSNRVGTWGSSAGGHLCLMTALAPDELFPGVPELNGTAPRFRCVVAHFPVTTFLVPEILSATHFNEDRVNRFLGGPYEENKAMAAKLSPVEYLNPASPPVLLMHGDRDQAAGYMNSTYTVEVAKKKGADVQLVTVTNGMHSFKNFEGKEIHPPIEEINRIAADFMAAKLLAP